MWPSSISSLSYLNFNIINYCSWALRLNEVKTNKAFPQRYYLFMQFYKVKIICSHQRIVFTWLLHLTMFRDIIGQSMETPTNILKVNTKVIFYFPTKKHKKVFIFLWMGVINYYNIVFKSCQEGYLWLKFTPYWVTWLM